MVLTKRLKTIYKQVLQHRFGGHSNIHIAVIKPGPTYTPMTTRFKQESMEMATPQKVASITIHSLAHKKLTIYDPKKIEINYGRYETHA